MFRTSTMNEIIIFRRANHSLSAKLCQFSQVLELVYFHQATVVIGSFCCHLFLESPFSGAWTTVLVEDPQFCGLFWVHGELQITGEWKSYQQSLWARWLWPKSARRSTSTCAPGPIFRWTFLVGWFLLLQICQNWFPGKTYDLICIVWYAWGLRMICKG